MQKATASAFAAAALVLAGPAFSQSADWTGVYVGAEAGYTSVDTNIPGVDGDGVIGGIIAGFDYDLGDWVVGAGADLDFSDANLATNGVDRILRLKLRGGYKIGKGLLYTTGGFANLKLDAGGSDDGYFVGGGYEYLTDSNLSIGGEILYHKIGSFKASKTDIEPYTYQVRATFRF